MKESSELFELCKQVSKATRGGTIMSIQYMNIGGFVLGIPQDKMFEVATLQVDIRPAIRNLQHASIKWSLDTQKAPMRTPSEYSKQHGKDTPPIKAQKFTCRKGCHNQFVSRRRRLTHERKYHTQEDL